jgi:Fe-S cluster biogenesis protein NfuA
MRACEGCSIPVPSSIASLKREEERKLRAFLYECKSYAEKNDNTNKCQLCKLRFQCYTEK